MVRSLLGGTTNYSHQSLDDIVDDLLAEARNAEAFVQKIEEGIARSKESGYWDSKVPYDVRSCIAYALRHYRTTIREVTDIIADFEVEIQRHHCKRIGRIASTADEINGRIGRIWHNAFENKEYGKEDYRIVETVYADTRDMAVNLLDFGNVATRLEDYVGKKRRVKRGPWSSGSFYLLAVVLLLFALAFLAKWVSYAMVPLLVIGAILLFGIVGAFQLRNDDRLREENFLKLVFIVYKRLNLLRSWKDNV